MSQPRLGYQELCPAIALALGTVLVAQMPYGLAYASAPPNLVFSGAVANITDVNSYLAEIRLGSGGAWLFHDRYTPEPHTGGPLFLFYTLLGKLAGLLVCPPDLANALARPLFGLLLLVVTYWFLTLVLPDRARRQMAFALLCLSSGLGWILLLFGQTTILGDMPIDLWVPEAITFHTLLTFPHFGLATSLVLLALGQLLLAFRTRRFVPAWWAALSCFALAWIHPFDMAIVCSVLAVYLAWHTLRAGLPWRWVAQVAPALLLSAPVVIYIQFGVIAPNPVFRAWMEQNAMLTPNLLACLLGYGFLIPLAAAGAVRLIRSRGQIEPLPLFWAGAVAVPMYVPISTQRRFLEGLHVPLCVLAAHGWPAVAGWLGRLRPASILLKSLLVAGLLASNAVDWASATFVAASHRYPNFIECSEADAFAWLAAHSEPEESVLASPLIGSFVPAWAGNRVVAGHWSATIDLPAEQASLEQFFAATTLADGRQEIVDRYGVIYLFYGPNERELGGYRPDADELWQPVYENGAITIYRSPLWTSVP